MVDNIRKGKAPNKILDKSCVTPHNLTGLIKADLPPE